jgi:hypothetical protein
MLEIEIQQRIHLEKVGLPREFTIEVFLWAELTAFLHIQTLDLIETKCQLRQPFANPWFPQ